MLFLVIRLGNDRYALDVNDVVEIVPLVRLKSLPGAPAGTAGLMNYRGGAVPVIDLNLIATGVPTPAALSSRIVITDYRVHGTNERETLGLLVPVASDVLQFNLRQFEPAGLRTDDTPYLGPVLATPDGVLQLVTVSALLTDELRAALFVEGRAA